MPTIVFANSKGGVGKTTSALVLAQVLAQSGATVSLLDADPNAPLATWANRTQKMPPNLHVVSAITEETILDTVDNAAARDAFVIVDLEGTANMAVGYAIGRADFVIIPSRGSQLDADQTARVVPLILRQAKAFRRDIPYAVLFTCTGAIRGRDFVHIKRSLEAAGVPVLPIEMTERAAFRAIMQLGGTIYDLSKSEVTNPEGAVANAERLGQAVLDALTGKPSTPSDAADAPEITAQPEAVNA